TGDTLAATTAGTSITATYDAASATLTLSGSDTLAHYQSVLGSVTYFSSSDNPTNFDADLTRTIAWQLNDGSIANNLSTPQTTTIAVTGINDAPVVANPIPDQASPEDNPVSFTLAVNTFLDADGNPLSYAATLGDGSALPAWLNFDAATQVFS